MQEQVGIQRNETNSIAFPGNAQVTRRAAGQVSSLIMRILKELRKKKKKRQKKPAQLMVACAVITYRVKKTTHWG